MSWLCENCSTYNPGKNKVCFVCDSKRSRESVRKARRLVIEEALDRMRPKIYKSVTVSGKVLFLGSIIVYSTVALVYLYLTMQNGLLNDLVLNGVAMVRNATANITALLKVNCNDIYNDIIVDSPIKYVGANFTEIWTQLITAVYRQFGDYVNEIIPPNLCRLNRIADNLIYVKDNAIESISVGIATLTVIYLSLSEKIKYIIANASHLIQKIREQLSQFNI